MVTFGNDGDTEVCAGSETDDALIARVVREIKAKAAIIEKDDSYLAGSQDIRVVRFKIGLEQLTLVVETYAGVSLLGPKELVKELAAAVAKGSRPTS